MSKKIIALALAIVFIATAFTACGNKLELTKINGKEYPLATNKDGETIVNEHNQVAVIVTDENEEVITYSDGEDQTRWVQINGSLVIEDRIQTKDYTLAIPKGWEGDERSGKVVKKDTDGNCYISFSQVATLKAMESMDTYLEDVDAQNTAISEGFADEEQMEELIKQNPGLAAFKGCKYTIEKNTETITSGNYNCQVRVHKITDKNGDIIHYAENYYFVNNKILYKIDYVCKNGDGYDSSFNFRQYISEGFTFKAEKK